jgi:hypothetical protein
VHEHIYIPSQREGAGIVVQSQAEICVQTADVKKPCTPAHVQVWKKVLPKSIDN